MDELITKGACVSGGLVPVALKEMPVGTYFRDFDLTSWEKISDTEISREGAPSLPLEKALLYLPYELSRIIIMEVGNGELHT